MAEALQQRLSTCIDDVSLWMKSNRLQLNPTKSEVLWCASARCQQQIPTGPVRIGDTSVCPVTAVRDLGVYLDADVSMTAHVTATVRTCFAALRQIRSMRRSLSREALLTLIHALVVSKLDYCNSVLVGVSRSLQRRLQSVLNAAAWLVSSTRRSEHTTPLFRDLHWLKVPEHVQFRLCVLAYRCLHGTAPSYLAETLQLTSSVESRRRLRSSSTSALLVQSTQWMTIGDRAFPVAAARAWNALPDSVRMSSSYMALRRQLKMLLFKASFGDDRTWMPTFLL